MLKIFISQSMLGKETGSFLDEQKEIKEAVLRKFGNAEIESISCHGTPFDAAQLRDLARNLRTISYCDALVTRIESLQAIGCLVEAVSACAYGVPVYVEEDGELERVWKIDLDKGGIHCEEDRKSDQRGMED